MNIGVTRNQCCTKLTKNDSSSLRKAAAQDKPQGYCWVPGPMHDVGTAKVSNCHWEARPADAGLTQDFKLRSHSPPREGALRARRVLDDISLLQSGDLSARANVGERLVDN